MRTARIGSVLVWMVCGAAASGQAPLQPVGVLPPPFSRTQVGGVSADGSVVYGACAYSTGPGTVWQGVIWTRAGGLEAVGSLGGSYSVASGASADGSVVAGAATTPMGASHAFLWTRAGGTEDLGAPAGSSVSGVVLSADGTALVADGYPLGGAIRWTRVAGFEVIGESVEPAAISADGSAVVCNGGTVAYRWTAATGLAPLPPSPLGWMPGLAGGWISADGRSVLGTLFIPGNDPAALFSWTDGGAVELYPSPSEPLMQRLWAASADGALLLTTNPMGGGSNVVHDGVLEDGAMYLRRRGADLSGWSGLWIAGVSEDQRTFVGNGMSPAARYEGWVVTLPLGCYANCDSSTAAPLLNVNDFVCFLGRFAAGNQYANCDGSTTAPVLNVNDFICFQTRFAAGCN